MNTAHIIIQIMESPDETDMQINLSFSGGEGLQREDSRTEFVRLVEVVKQALSQVDQS